MPLTSIRIVPHELSCQTNQKTLKSKNEKQAWFMPPKKDRRSGSKGPKRLTYPKVRSKDEKKWKLEVEKKNGP